MSFPALRPANPFPTPQTLVPGELRVWEQEVVLPTYQTGDPERLPVFFERRVYQGSIGKV